MTKLLTLENAILSYDQYERVSAKAKEYNASPEEIDEFVFKIAWTAGQSNVEQLIEDWKPVGCTSSSKAINIEEGVASKKSNKIIDNIIEKVSDRASKVEKVDSSKQTVTNIIDAVMAEIGDIPEIKSLEETINKELPELVNLFKTENLDRAGNILGNFVADSILKFADNFIGNGNNVIDVDPSELKEVKKPLSKEEVATDDEESNNLLDMIINLDDAKNSLKLAHIGDDTAEMFEHLKDIFAKELFAAIKIGKITRNQKIIVTPINENDWELVSIVEESPGYSRQLMAIRICDIYNKPSSNYFNRSEVA